MVTPMVPVLDSRLSRFKLLLAKPGSVWATMRIWWLEPESMSQDWADEQKRKGGSSWT